MAYGSRWLRQDLAVFLLWQDDNLLFVYSHGARLHAKAVPFVAVGQDLGFLVREGFSRLLWRYCRLGAHRSRETELKESMVVLVLVASEKSF